MPAPPFVGCGRRIFSVCRPVNKNPRFFFGFSLDEPSSRCAKLSFMSKRTSGQADKRTSGQADKRTSGQADKRTSGQADKRTSGQADKRTSGQADKRTSGQADKRTSGQADKRTSGQADRRRRNPTTRPQIRDNRNVYRRRNRSNICPGGLQPRLRWGRG